MMVAGGRGKAVLPSVDRTPRATRVNRIVLTLLGLLLLTAGGLGTALSLRVFGAGPAREPVVSPRLGRLGGYGWFWLVVGVTALVLALLALSWLLIQSGSSKVHHLSLEPDRSRGRTTLDAHALTEAVTEEVGSYRGVSRAGAALRGTPASPTLLVSAWLEGRARAGEVRRRVETAAVPHARQALDAPELPVRLELRLASRPVRRVE